MAVQRLVLKESPTWTLGVRYTNGEVRLYLTAKSAKREYGGTDDLALSEAEWERLVKWVEFQRASEEAREGARRSRDEY
jgi:hypothetical protein